MLLTGIERNPECGDMKAVLSQFLILKFVTSDDAIEFTRRLQADEAFLSRLKNRIGDAFQLDRNGIFSPDETAIALLDQAIDEQDSDPDRISISKIKLHYSRLLARLDRARRVTHLGENEVAAMAWQELKQELKSFETETFAPGQIQLQLAPPTESTSPESRLWILQIRKKLRLEELGVRIEFELKPEVRQLRTDWQRALNTISTAAAESSLPAAIRIKIANAVEQLDSELAKLNNSSKHEILAGFYPLFKQHLLVCKQQGSIDPVTDRLVRQFQEQGRQNSLSPRSIQLYEVLQKLEDAQQQ